jgi:hypothetical protein
MANETANDKFRRLVWAVAEADANMDDNRLNELRENFRTAFVQQGYSTSENSECMQFITVGQTNDGTSLRRPTIGYCLVDTDINISDIMNAAEGCPMPQQVADQCPKLTQSHWDASLRMATMFFVALQGAPIPDDANAG